MSIDDQLERAARVVDGLPQWMKDLEHRRQLEWALEQKAVKDGEFQTVERMTPKQIKEKREELGIRMKELQLRHKLELETLRHEFKMLQLQCKHAEAYSYTDRDGGGGSYCPTCGQGG